MADEPVPKKGGSGGLITKVVAAVFAGIIAPVAVAVGIQWANRHVQPPPDKGDPVTPKVEPVTSKETPKPPESGVVDLITPNLADHFRQYAWNEEQQKDAWSDVIDPNLFRYEDKPGRIFVVGSPRDAVLNTRAEYEDYTLHLCYRWGGKSYYGPKEPPEGYPRKGSVGVHATGVAGTVSGIFGQGVAVRIGEGQFGTINVNGLPGVLTCKAKVIETQRPDGKLRRVYSPDAPAIPIASREPENWQPAMILQRGFPDYADYKAGFWVGEGVGRGWHPEGDPTMKKVEPPYGPTEWNKVRIECRGAAVKVHVNGKLMNEITDLNVHRGHISISSMRADWEIGRLEVEIHPPAKAAEKPAEKAKP